MPTAIKPIAESFPLGGLEDFGRSAGATDDPQNATSKQPLVPNTPLPEVTDEETSPPPDGTASEDQKQEQPEEPAKKPEKPLSELSEEEMVSGSQSEEQKAAKAAEGARKQEAEAQAKAETDQKAKNDEKSAPNQESGSAQRDSDIEAIKLAPHAHPKTGKLFKDLKQHTVAARNERDEARRLALQHETKLKELEHKLAQVSAQAVPKEVEEKLKAYEERIRELDIAQDPQIQSKYDKRIGQNEQGVIDILKKNGFGMAQGEGGKWVENPTVIDRLKKNGVTLSSLVSTLKSLDAADPEKFPDAAADAESIRELLRDNSRLSREKQGEIESWKANYGERQKQRETQTKQQAENQAKLFREETESQLSAATQEIEKSFPHLKAPSAPSSADAPAVAKAKQEAIDAFTQAEKRVQDAIKALDPNGVPPEKIPALVGRINSSAIAYHMLKEHVLPKVLKELAAKDARIKALEGDAAKVKQAHTLSSSHARETTRASQSGDVSIPKDMTNGDAMLAFAKGRGLNVNVGS